ncbi:MAG: hypothetical protein IPI48_04810 [bacterium]|nr:hypothetical protein [bacterium]
MGVENEPGANPGGQAPQVTAMEGELQVLDLDRLRARALHDVGHACREGGRAVLFGEVRISRRRRSRGSGQAMLPETEPVGPGSAAIGERKPLDRHAQGPHVVHQALFAGAHEAGRRDLMLPRQPAQEVAHGRTAAVADTAVGQVRGQDEDPHG